MEFWIKQEAGRNTALHGYAPRWQSAAFDLAQLWPNMTAIIHI
jgi:hypothetical protein